jgi:hypothetical protein
MSRAGGASAQFLTIEEHEATMMKRLHAFIPSPRAAKRLVNVYRLFRAMVPDEDYGEFMQQDYQVVLLLLAMLTGYHGPTTEILRHLVSNPTDEDWWTFVDGFRTRVASPDDTLKARSEAGSWVELMDNLRAIREGFPTIGTASRFARHAPMVGRFSFQPGRVR